MVEPSVPGLSSLNLDIDPMARIDLTLDNLCGYLLYNINYVSSYITN
jgi:hypothetical protein